MFNRIEVLRLVVEGAKIMLLRTNQLKNWIDNRYVEPSDGTYIFSRTASLLKSWLIQVMTNPKASLHCENPKGTTAVTNRSLLSEPLFTVNDTNCNKSREPKSLQVVSRGSIQRAKQANERLLTGAKEKETDGKTRRVLCKQSGIVEMEYKTSQRWKNAEKRKLS